MRELEGSEKWTKELSMYTEAHMEEERTVKEVEDKLEICLIVGEKIQVLSTKQLQPIESPHNVEEVRAQEKE